MAVCKVLFAVLTISGAITDGTTRAIENSGNWKLFKTFIVLLNQKLTNIITNYILTSHTRDYTIVDSYDFFTVKNKIGATIDSLYLLGVSLFYALSHT